MLQKLVVLILLVLFVSGDQREEKTVRIVHGLQNQQPPGSTEKQQQQRLRRSFDKFFSSKRKVPNAADPLHNR